MTYRPPFETGFPTRIYCTRCKRAVAAMKIRPPYSDVRAPSGWKNRCGECGELYDSLAPGDGGRRRAVRRAKRAQRELEQAGQLRLFPNVRNGGR
jgi:hypothetical protein